MENIKYHLLVILASILVAGSFLASEKLAGIINSYSLTLLRFVAASLLLLPVVLSKAQWRNKIFSTLPRSLIISLFQALFFVGFFESLKTTTSLNTGSLFTLVPLMTALLSLLIFKQRITRKQLVVYILGVIGCCWVIFADQLAALSSISLNKGDFIFIAAIFSMCLYVFSMKLLYRGDAMIVIVLCNLIGGAFWMLLALLISGESLHWNLIQGKSVLHMAYLIIAATLGTVYLVQVATIALGPNRVNAYIYLNPALVALLLFIVNGVAIPMIVIPGILISVFATIILQKRDSSEASAK